ncbi:hypothetical protein [Pseudarthrobacter sp. AB1]|uniref:hypothetical protein n=1 Tax=Pseudarthrobacter sp. AB1 TaxID=2138309 RepID=UPI00186B9A8E|nr:hypothetical protein [Pseudarthrobacter sp. AB1]MBE4720499.1 hypothetical protein [Pseudarthrobacter sp. AB1]
MYLHRSLRDPDATPSPPCPKVFDATWALILGHRSCLRAGVPGCTCGVTFAAHATFIADHAQHLSDEVVRHVLGYAIRVLEEEPARADAAADRVRSMLSQLPAPETVLAAGPA